MSIKIELESGEVYYDPEPSEIEAMEYIYLLCDEYPNGEHYPDRFFDRMCKGLIKAPFNKVQFAGNDEIIPTIEGFGLDLEKFWLVLLFIYDWSEQQFLRCMPVTSPLESLRQISDYAENGEDFQIDFRALGRKTITADTTVKQVLMAHLSTWLQAWEQHPERETLVYTSDDRSEFISSASYKVCFAYEKYTQLFGLLRLPRFGDRKTDKHGFKIMYDKTELVARILAFYKYPNNPEMFGKDSLKGILKSYRGRLPQVIASIYD